MNIRHRACTSQISLPPLGQKNSPDMTVGELIELLSHRPRDAQVVVGDPHDGGVGGLHAKNIRDVRLRFDEANGVGWLELVDTGDQFDVTGVWIA